MIIYGAGMAGLLAGNVLRRFDPKIIEAQDELPNNHAALLRFRTDAAAIATNIPFKKVQVNKLIDVGGVLYDRPNLKFTNMYSQKVTSKIMGRSIASLEPVERYIAPPDFIHQLSKSLNIVYGTPLIKLGEASNDREPTISTIPMNIIMDIVDWPNKPEFNYSSIWSVWAEFEEPITDVYQTVYYPDPDDPYYRISITGNVLIAEYIKEPSKDQTAIFEQVASALDQSFGIPLFRLKTPLNIKQQKYGKLLPIDDHSRREFIMYLTDEYRIYSLGRFATWRQLLLDDILDDIKIIGRMIEHRDDYQRKLLANGV